MPNMNPDNTTKNLSFFNRITLSLSVMAAATTFAVSTLVFASPLLFAAAFTATAFLGSALLLGASVKLGQFFKALIKNSTNTSAAEEAPITVTSLRKVPTATLEETAAAQIELPKSPCTEQPPATFDSVLPKIKTPPKIILNSAQIQKLLKSTSREIQLNTAKTITTPHTMRQIQATPEQIKFAEKLLEHHEKNTTFSRLALKQATKELDKTITRTIPSKQGLLAGPKVTSEKQRAAPAPGRV